MIDGRQQINGQDGTSKRRAILPAQHLNEDVVCDGPEPETTGSDQDYGQRDADHQAGLRATHSAAGHRPYFGEPAHLPHCRVLGGRPRSRTAAVAKHFPLPATTVGSAMIAIGGPTFKVMATAILRTDDEFAARSEWLFAEGTLIPEKRGRLTDRDGPDIRSSGHLLR